MRPPSIMSCVGHHSHVNVGEPRPRRRNSSQMAKHPTVPLWVKLAYTAFVAVLVPYYWTTYTAWNFLFFCDLALLVTLVALWTESPLLASIPAVGIILPQLLWVFDFLTGGRVINMAGYMFDPKLPLFVRALSSFHGWLPFVLLWLVWR